MIPKVANEVMYLEPRIPDSGFPTQRTCYHNIDMYQFDLLCNCAISQIMHPCFVNSLSTIVGVKAFVTVRCCAVQYFYFALCSLSLIVQRCCREVGTIVRDKCVLKLLIYHF